MHRGKTADVIEHTAKSLFEQVKNMTAEHFAIYVLDARLKKNNGVECTQLEEMLCDAQIETRVKELRKLTCKAISNVIYASRVKDFGQVQPGSAFKDTWKQLAVTMHDKSLLTPVMPRLAGSLNTVSLQTFLDFRELHQNVTLFLPGLSRTGKSELAKHICLLLALSYQPFADARFIMTNTLDSLRNNQSVMLPGVPVLLDGIGGDSNENQLIYSSISMWKAVLQVKDATQNRARNDDLMWAARQPKVLTTNCDNLTDWIQTMFSKSTDNHKQAIVLRVAEVESIEDSLYSSACAPSGSQTFLHRQMSTKEASETIANLFGQ